MNVLLTCAGRRNYLVQYFQEALSGRGEVYSADASPDAPAMEEADRAFLVPPVDAPGYFDAVLALCRKHRVRLLISLNDLELPLLARQRQRFLQVGTWPVVSSPEVIDTCWDKWKTTRFLSSCGIGSPKTYLSLLEARRALRSGELRFPLVIKPRWGTASIGIFYPENEEELEFAYRYSKANIQRTILAEASKAGGNRSILIQERLQGQEHGIDVINDLEGGYVCTFVKRKLAMRSGETDRAVTVQHPELESLGRKIGERLGHVANLDCDVFLLEDGCRVLELNSRFGGGYPFSHAAGANLPAALIAWAEGREPDPSWLTVQPEVIAAKCDRLVLRRSKVDESFCGY